MNQIGSDVGFGGRELLGKKNRGVNMDRADPRWMDRLEELLLKNPSYTSRNQEREDKNREGKPGC